MSFLVEEFAPKDPLMRQAWVDCLRWAAGEPGIIAQFKMDSGMTEIPKEIPEGVLGRDFVAWFNDNVWGENQ